MKRKLLSFAVLVVCGLSKLQAQDHVYSQFYNAPNYLNPALNGQFEGDLRMNLIYRNQWSSLPGNQTFLTFSADYKMPALGGGLGLLATSSNEGSAYLRKLNISGIYSYSVDFDNAVLSFGLQAGFTQREIDYSKIVFGDQIDPIDGIIPGAVSGVTLPEYNNKYFFDAGAGANLVVGSFMAGIASQHINRPNESFTGSKATLPVRISAHASYRLSLDPYNMDDNAAAVIPSVVMYTQAKSSSVSAGCQYKYKGANVGLWYRSGTKGGSDAMVVSLIFDLFVRRDSYDKVRLGISHDATLSKMQYGNTSGTSEAALSYETTLPSRANTFPGRSRRSNSRRCHEFY